MHKQLFVLALATLAGCVSLPELRQPALDPPAASQPAPVIPADWWKIYGDPVLNTMIDEALAHNADLRLAAIRIEEARAYLGLAEASLYPEVSAGVGAARDRRTEVGAMPAPSNPISNSFTVDLRAFYEVDLWGRYRSASETARAELLASQYGREVVYTTLTAGVAKGYFALRSLDAQSELARDTLENRRQALALMQRRFESGEISELEVRLAEAKVASVEAALAQRVQQTRLVETALAGLLGRQPRQIVATMLPRGLSLQALTLPPEIPADLPSELLARRPDVRQAEASLIAARARIDQAKAALYPSLGLTAYLGSESRALADLFSGPATVWGIAASLMQTVFDAGRNEAALQATVARQEMVLIGYEETVKRAFREALDALIVYRHARERAEAETRQSEALRRALTLADLRHRYGESGYLEVLYAQRTLFDSEQRRILARELRLIALADLFRALGGGWDSGMIAKASGSL